MQKLLSLKLPHCDIFIAYDNGEESGELPIYFKNHTLFSQVKGELGYRMHEAFTYVFSLGYKQVALIGSDIPEINETIIQDAFQRLSNSDVILSPSFDGGYYLIGFHPHTLCKEAFEGITYSQKDVFTKTKERLHALHVSHGKTLRDIDTIEDMKAYAPHLLPKLPRLSVIIPVYHEDESLVRTIAHLHATSKYHDFEIIIVDTLAITTINRLRVKDVRIGYAPQGRASQMNEGLAMAQGAFVLFLHADTLLPQNWDELIEKSLHVRPAGAFSLGIDDTHFALHFIERMANVRTSVTRIPYGDQAHFFQTRFLRELGGYAQIPLMEDVELMCRLKKQKVSITLLDEKVLTSARRWHKEGILYTTLRNRILSFLYFLGVSPKHLLKHYKMHR